MAKTKERIVDSLDCFAEDFEKINLHAKIIKKCRV